MFQRPVVSTVQRILSSLQHRQKFFLSQRGAKTSVSDLRKGDWIDIEGRALVIQSTSSSFSGRGARQFLLTLKDAVNDAMTTVKPSARDYFENKVYTFLYEANGNIYLLNPKTLEEISIPSKLASGNLLKVLEGGMEIKVRTRDGDGDRPIVVYSSNQNFKCTVTDVLERPGDKKHSVVLTQGGARVSANAILEAGDQIMISVSDFSYQGKAV